MDLRTTLTTPGWHRSVLIRRTLSGLLFFIAAVLFIRSMISADPQVAVFTADIPAGTTISSTDMVLTDVPPELIPGTAVLDPLDAVGRITASAITTGEIVTTPRFVGNELIASFVTNATADPPSETVNMVPLKLADPSIIPLLQHGDTISVVSHDPGTGHPQTIAAGGRVILADPSGGGDPATLLVALPETTAGIVAAASLSSPLTVVLTGDRAG